MTTDNRDKILETLLKMSALTEEGSGAFQGEISAASAKIQQMMDKYSISWAEVHAKQAADQAKEFEKEFAGQPADYVFKSIKKWHWQLAHLIERVTHTRCYSSGWRQAHHILFFGTEENAAAAAQLFALWVVNLEAMSLQSLKEYKRSLLRKYKDRPNFFSSLPYDEQPKNYRESWVRGCITEMNKNVREQEVAREPAVENAIVLFHEELKRQWDKFAADFVYKKTSSRSSSSTSVAGYTNGQKAGAGITLGSKSIGSGAKLLKG